MVTDPISDLLVRLRNGFRRHHDVVTMPASKLKHEVLRVLQAEGFIQGIESATEDGHPVLKVQLRYVSEGQPMITGMSESADYVISACRENDVKFIRLWFTDIVGALKH